MRDMLYFKCRTLRDIAAWAESADTYEHQMSWAIWSMKLAISASSWLPDRQAAMSHRQARYWQNTMVPIRQLSQGVLMMRC